MERVQIRASGRKTKMLKKPTTASNVPTKLINIFPPGAREGAEPAQNRPEKVFPVRLPGRVRPAGQPGSQAGLGANQLPRSRELSVGSANAGQSMRPGHRRAWDRCLSPLFRRRPDGSGSPPIRAAENDRIEPQRALPHRLGSCPAPVAIKMSAVKNAW